MRTLLRPLLIVVLFASLAGMPLVAHAKTDEPGKAMEAATAITKITGVAISPLLGTAGCGAWDYFHAQPDQKDKLAWYAHPSFWIPAFLLVGAVAFKDSVGTVIPHGLKKPLDVAETVENKISGLVAAGAFVPMVASIFPMITGSGSHQALHGATVMLAGAGSFNWASLLNILTVPFAMTAFVLVWLVGHAINVLILLSPWGGLDAGLKAFRTFLLGSVTVTHFANPKAGVVLSLIIIVIAYFLAGWSFRMMWFGMVYIWDFVTGKRKHFQLDPAANKMFLARQIEKTPIRTYGKLSRTAAGKLVFNYRPWLFMKQRTLELPDGDYVVGRGLFYPEIFKAEGTGDARKQRTMLLLPPRYKSHEGELAKIYTSGALQDVGLLKGFKAAWRWLKSLFGFASKPEPATVPAT